MDGQRRAQGSLAGNALPARAGGLFVGGADWPHPAPAVPLQGFAGTVADLVVDSS